MARHLTLTELLLNLLLWSGVGWWFGGRWGAAAGGVAVLLLLSRAIWIASQGAADRPTDPEDREPGA